MTGGFHDAGHNGRHGTGFVGMIGMVVFALVIAASVKYVFFR
jgi:K+ transporter